MQTQWGRLYANFLANAKPVQGMQLLGFRCFMPRVKRVFRDVLACKKEVASARPGFLVGNKKGLETQGLSSNLWCPGETRSIGCRCRC